MLTTRVAVTGCHDCPFFSNEYCNVGAGNVVNEWRAEAMPDRCPLRQSDYLVTRPAQIK